MPQANPNYNLFVLKPNLVKEWHLTKNTSLKPQEVTPGSGKKVWWICKEGHEWEAVVYSRSRGSGCPHCNKSNSADGSSVAVASSDLMREWHPTANGNLRPANVTIGDPDKVWWICREGHEWQSTFKARIKGKDCPICAPYLDKNIQSRSLPGISDSAAAIHTDSAPEIEPLDSIFGKDFRKIRRFKTKATVTLEIPSSNDLFYAQMKNFSHEGMCVEASTAITPGTKVCIKLDRPLFRTSHDSFDSIIRWCKGLTDEEGTVYNFGLGLKFI